MGRGKDKRKSPKRQSETKGEAKKNGAKVKSEEVKVRMGKGKGQSKEGGKVKEKTWISEWKRPQSGKLFLQMKRINVRKTLL